MKSPSTSEINRLEAIIKNILSPSPISEEILNGFTSHVSVHKFKKGDQVCPDFKNRRFGYIVNTGVVRVYHKDKKGKEVNKLFNVDGEFLCTYNALELGNIFQSIETSEIFLIPSEKVNDLYQKYETAKEFSYLVLRDEWNKKELLTKIMTLPTAEARYDMLLQHFPIWVNRVPLYHLASLLNLTPVHLSRIRKLRS
jgi:signal-transduction protein with cAMP-binding, CBS, and nucleotidyltransferase domain